MREPADGAARVAQRVRAAFEAADLRAIGDLLDPDVQWGPPDAMPVCRDRDQVLAWYRQRRDEGIRARVLEVAVRGDRVVVGLRVTGSPGARYSGGELEVWQVLTVRDGRVVDIAGFGERDEAVARAEHGPAPGRRRGTLRWTPPGRPLADGPIRLRLPVASDAAALHSYARRPGGLDGTWVPAPGDASPEDCQVLVDDWLAGWQDRPSTHGPALVIAEAGDDRLAGVVGLVYRGDDVVELAYGVAPDRRGRGYASRAAGLAARWLLADRGAREVELRIEPGNAASQLVAAAAGFTPAGTVTSRVPETGETYEDLRFVMRPG